MSLTSKYAADTANVRRLANRDRARNPALAFLISLGIPVGQLYPSMANVPNWTLLTLPITTAIFIMLLVCGAKGSRPQSGTITALWLLTIPVFILFCLSLPTIVPAVLALIFAGVVAFFRANTN